MLLSKVTHEEWAQAGEMVDEDEYWTRVLPADPKNPAS
jgi:hypothetical protein